MAGRNPQWRGFVYSFRLAYTGSPGWLALALLLSLATGLIPPVQLYLLGVVISRFTDQVSVGSLVLPSVALGALMGVGLGLNSIRNTGSFRVANAAEVAAMEALVTAIGGFEPADMENAATRDRVEVARETSRVKIGAYWESFLGWLTQAVTTVGVVVVLSRISWIAAGLLLLAAVPPVFFTGRIFRTWREVSTETAPLVRRHDVLMQYLLSPSGVVDSRTNSLFRTVGANLTTLWKQQARWRVRAADVESSSALISAGITAVLLSLSVLFLATQDAGAGQIAVVLGSLSTLSVLINVFFTVTSLLSDLPYIAELESLCSSRPSPSPGSTIPPRTVGSIELRDVSYRYPGRVRAAVCRASVVFHSGTLYSIVGSNGSGKSTLLRVLAGLYSPTTGSARYDGIDAADVRRLDPEAVAFMSQDIPRPPVRLREYLAGSANLAEHHLWTALENARSSDVVRELPDRLETLIGVEYEGGTQFSGGQWQRIALARMFASRASVWMLDEPTSALDPRAEQECFGLIKESLGDRLSIVVTHRMSTAQRADVILVMDNGAIVETGSFKELMDRRGRFRQLFETRIDDVD